MSVAADRLATALASRYRLDRELGQGGMATVYLAHDLKHDRDVALKVLRPELAAVLGRERFLAEIQLTARLDHPHILTLIDSGESVGFLWYVVPYIRGESLRQKLEREKQLGVDEALAITKQVAGALDYAHHQGVIHRDIKPENILLHEGEAMLADFGIALAVREAGGNRLTESGLSLGTPQYMSPEQATGDRQLDARSDVYSLAAVLYEQLAGEPPHTGATVQAVIAKLMTERPTRLRVVRDTVPEGVDNAVAKALAKVPADRFGSAVDFAQALERGATAPTATLALAVPRHGPARRVATIAAALVGLSLVGIAAWLLRTGRASRVARPAEERQITFTGDATLPAVSPDGKWLAYVSGDTTLMVQELAGGRAVPVLRGAMFRQPSWSPEGDNLMVGAALDGDLARDGTWEIPRLGGEPRRVGGNSMSAGYAPDGTRLAWTNFDTIVIADRRSGAVTHRFVAGELTAIVQVRWSPDGRWLALAGMGPKLTLGILVVDPAGRSRNVVTREASSISGWGQDGALLYVRRGIGLVRQSIDQTSGMAVGAPTPVLTRLSDVTSLDLSADGRSLVVQRSPRSNQILAVTATPGKTQAKYDIHPLTSNTRAKGWRPVVSPDGRWVIWHEVEGRTSSLLVAPFEDGSSRVLARYEGPSVWWKLWAPDSRRFGYFTADSSGAVLFTGNIDGSDPVPLATIDLGSINLGFLPWAWTASGIVVMDSSRRDFLLLDPVSRKSRRFVTGDSVRWLGSPLLSPDGGTLLTVRGLPPGSWNELWKHPADGGAWTRVAYDAPGDPTLLLWDASGIYLTLVPNGRPNAPFEIWRAPSLGAPFAPFLTGLQWCSGAAPSLSNDHRHLACNQATGTSDIWVVSDFDPKGQ